MRWIVTLILVIGVVVTGVVALLPKSALTRNAPRESTSVQTLEEHLKPSAIKQIDIAISGEQPLVLTKDADGKWSQPGNWPVREKEVADLVDVLSTLKTRFQPVSLVGDSPDLKPYGLDPSQKPTVVKVSVKDKVISLTLGQPKPTAGESSHHAYLRVDNDKEVLRIGTDTLSQLSRSPEEYRRKQLFPMAERIKLAGGLMRSPLLGDAIASIKVTGPEGSFTIIRTLPTPKARRDAEERSSEPALSLNLLADSWEIVDPIRDHVDPEKLKSILTGLPNLWVTGFSKDTDLKLTGLDNPERTITVTPVSGKPLTLRIGKINPASRKTRIEKTQPPPGTPIPPMDREVVENYHYAKFDDNNLIFEIAAEQFNNVFAKIDDLRDASLARFESNDVIEIVVKNKDQQPVVLKKKRGNKDATNEDDKQDRWYVGDILAETGKVTELLSQVSGFEVKAPLDRIDSLDGWPFNVFATYKLGFETGSTITVTTQPAVTEGEPAIPAKSVTYQLGNSDAMKKKVYAMVQGWPRVSLVDDAVVKFAERSALAYRSRRLFDTAEVKLDKLTVNKTGGETFELAKKATGDTWQLIKPLTSDTDLAKSTAFTGELSRMEAVEYVDDAPKPEDLMGKYGLAMPKYVVDLNFTGTNAKPAKIAIGSIKPGSSDAYARLNATGSVFVVAKSVVEALEKGSLDLLPLQLWSTTPDKFVSLEVTREGMPAAETYKLTKDGEKWKLSGPFDAEADVADLQAVFAALANMNADKYESLTENDQQGLKTPYLKVVVSYKEAKPDSKSIPPEEQVITRTLIVGKNLQPGSPSRFAMLQGGTIPAVFSLNTAAIAGIDRPALQRLSRNLLQFDPAKLSKLQIVGTNADANITIIRDDKGLWKPEAGTFPLDLRMIGNMAFNVSNPPVIRLAAYGANTKWADYGLDKPAYTITATLAGEKPEVHIIQLGKEEPTGERYIRIDNGNAVGVVSGATNAAIARGKLELIDRTLMTFDRQELIAITRKKGAEEFELTQTGVNWDVTKPQKFRADAATIEELGNFISQLRAERVAAYAPADLKSFGLDTPAAVVTFKVGIDKPVDKSLKIGKPVEDAKPNGDRFVMIDTKGETIVGVLPGMLIERMMQDPIRFKDKSLAKFVDADKVIIERGDRKVTLAKVNGTWKVTEPTSAEAEQIDLDELVNAAAKLRADDIVAEKPTDLKPYGLDTPSAKIQFFAGDKEVLNVILGSKEKDGPRIHGKLDKGDIVVLFDPGLTSRLTGEYRKRSVWTGVDASQIQSLTMSAENSNFNIRRAGMAWVDLGKQNDRFDTAKITDTLAALAGLKAERYAADKDANLKLYGLEQPKMVIVVEQPGGIRKTLQIGGFVGGTNDKQVYARVDEPGRTDVFVLSTTDTAKLVRTRSDYLQAK